MILTSDWSILRVLTSDWLKVLPHYYELPDLAGQDVKDQLCKLAAELAVNTDKLTDPATAASNVYDR